MNVRNYRMLVSRKRSLHARTARTHDIIFGIARTRKGAQVSDKDSRRVKQNIRGKVIETLVNSVPSEDRDSAGPGIRLRVREVKVADSATVT